MEDLENHIKNAKVDVEQNLKNEKTIRLYINQRISRRKIVDNTDENQNEDCFQRNLKRYFIYSSPTFTNQTLFLFHS